MYCYANTTRTHTKFHISSFILLGIPPHSQTQAKLAQTYTPPSLELRRKASCKLQKFPCLFLYEMVSVLGPPYPSQWEKILVNFPLGKIGKRRPWGLCHHWDRVVLLQLQGGWLGRQGKVRGDGDCVMCGRSDCVRGVA